MHIFEATVALGEFVRAPNSFSFILNEDIQEEHPPAREVLSTEIQVAFIPLVFVKASAPVRSQSGAVVAARGWSCFLVLLRSCIECRMEVQTPGRHVQGGWGGSSPSPRDLPSN